MSEFGEPWRLCDREIDIVMANGDRYAPDFLTPEHRRRIAACVNFCRGLPTSFLEQHDIIGSIETGAMIDLKSNHIGRDPLIEATSILESK